MLLLVLLVAETFRFSMLTKPQCFFADNVSFADSSLKEWDFGSDANPSFHPGEANHALLAGGTSMADWSQMMSCCLASAMAASDSHACSLQTAQTILFMCGALWHQDKRAISVGTITTCSGHSKECAIKTSLLVKYVPHTANPGVCVLTIALDTVVIYTVPSTYNRPCVATQYSSVVAPMVQYA